MTEHLTLVSDFNIEILGRLLSHSDPTMKCDVDVAPFNQVFQTLTANDGENNSTGVVWTRPDGVCPSFASALNFHEPDIEACLAEVELFAKAVLNFAGRTRYCFVASWTMPPDHRGYGILDWRPGLGLTYLMAQMNSRLAERLDETNKVYLLDADRWRRNVTKAGAPKSWFAAKVPYSNSVFIEAAADIKAALLATSGESRRLIVIDLDNTIWGGVVGESGWQELRLGGHDHLGESYKAFQVALKAMTNRGVQLAVVSKNDEKIALEAIERHPEMVLRRDDLVAWRINWQDKAANISDLLDEVGFGQASTVFIDDNPAERLRIQDAMPNILVPEWPKDPSQYADALFALRAFDTATVSMEDRKRTVMYKAERSRRKAGTEVASVEDWLEKMGTVITANSLKAQDVPRIGQLFNKTNQLNLSTRRLTEAQIVDWAEQDNHSFVALSVSDRFGDMGLTGLVGLEVAGDEGTLIDFVLSCRVMGRNIEETMIHIAVSEARKLGARRLVACFLPTERNAPTLSVLAGSGLTSTDDKVFQWDCKQSYPMPSAITLQTLE